MIPGILLKYIIADYEGIRLVSLPPLHCRVYIVIMRLEDYMFSRTFIEVPLFTKRWKFLKEEAAKNRRDRS